MKIVKTPVLDFFVLRLHIQKYPILWNSAPRFSLSGCRQNLLYISISDKLNPADERLSRRSPARSSNTECLHDGFCVFIPITIIEGLLNRSFTALLFH